MLAVILIPAWSGSSSFLPVFNFKYCVFKFIIAGNLYPLPWEGSGGSASDPILLTTPSTTPKSLAGNESILMSAFFPTDTNPIDLEQVSKAIEIVEISYQESIKNNPGLNDWLGAELNRIKQQHKSIQQKIEKAKKSNFEGQLKKVAKLKENLFPKQKLQERTLNLLHFCNNSSPKDRLQELYRAIDPLTNDFTILIENETK